MGSQKTALRIASLVLTLLMLITVAVPEALAAAWVADVDNTSDNWLTVINPDLSQKAYDIAMASDGPNLYIAWREPNADGRLQLHVAQCSGGVLSRIDGGGINGLNHDPSQDASNVKLVVVAGVLYVVWQEFHASGPNGWFLHARQYAGSPGGWIAIDGGTDYGITSDQSNLNLRTNTGFGAVAYNGSLCLAWSEGVYGTGGDSLRVAQYTGGAWSQLGVTPLNDTMVSKAAYPSLAVYGGKLYMAWETTDATAVPPATPAIAVTVACYAPGTGWTSDIACDSIHNPASANGMHNVTLCADDANLYALIQEQVGGVARLEAKRYAGDADGNWLPIDAGTGLNYSLAKSAYLKSATTHNGALYVSFSEDNTTDISQLRVKQYSGAWLFVDDHGLTGGTGGAVGLNSFPAETSVYYSALCSSAGELYIAWSDGGQLLLKKYDSAVTASADSADMASLALSNGTLSPAFQSDRYCYSAIVANAVTSITLTPTLARPDAAIKINGIPVGNGVTSFPVPLTDGANTVTIDVYSYRGVIIKRTVVTVYRLTADNRLLLKPVEDICIDTLNGSLGTADWYNQYRNWVGYEVAPEGTSSYYSGLKYDYSWLTGGAITNVRLRITIPSGGLSVTQAVPEIDVYASNDDSWNEKTSTTLSKGTALITDQAVSAEGTVFFASPGLTSEILNSTDKVVTLILEDNKAAGPASSYINFHSGEAAAIADQPTLELSLAPTDTTAPSVTPLATNVTDTAFDLQLTANEGSSADYVVLADGATAPDAAHVKAHQDADGAAPVRSGTLSLTAAAPALATVSGLAQDAAYDVYIVAADSFGNVMASPVKLDVATAAPARFAFSSTAYTVDEDAGSVTLTINRTGNTVGSVSATCTVASGAGNTATAGGDYTDAITTLTFADGQKVKTLAVPILADDLVEGDETFQATLTASGGGAVDTPTATVTIVDEDCTISVLPGSVQENAGTATVTVRRTGAVKNAVTVDYTTAAPAAADIAVAGSDYMATSGTLTFAAGQSEGTFTVTITDDAVYEAIDEAFLVRLSNPSAGGHLGVAEATVTITGPSDQPVITWQSGSYTVTENGSAVIMTVVRSGDATPPVTVQYATADDTALAGIDYTVASGALSFLAGEKTKTVSVPILDDGLVEADKRFNVILSSPGGGAVLDATPGADTASVTITNDDARPTVAFSAASYSIGENGGTVSLTVNRTVNTAGALEIHYSTGGGTATAGSDYTSVVDGTLSFPAGAGSATITIPVQNDNIVESSESFQVTLADHPLATITMPVATVTILDDDFGLSFAPVPRVDENVGSVTLAVIRTGASQLPLTVDYVTVDGAALAGSDYTSVSGTISFAAGQTQAPITVPILNDTIYEAGDEDFQVQVSGLLSSGAPVAASATVTIKGPSDAPAIAWGNAAYGVAESGGKATLTVQRAGDTSLSVTADYATADGSAAAGSDYVAASGTLSFAPGETTKTVDVTITDDSSSESSEMFTVTLSNPTGGATLGTTSTTVTISDNDTPPAPPSPPAPPTVDVIIDGSVQSGGTVTSEVVDGRTVTTVTVDPAAMSTRLSNQPDGATVVIPVTGSSDQLSWNLAGGTMQSLQDRDMTLQVGTPDVRVTLPLANLNTNSLAAQFGPGVELGDMSVSIAIAQPQQDTVRVVEDSAQRGNLQIVVQPIDFTITCTHDNQTATLSHFAGYVDRTVAVPEGVDPSRITTAVVLNADGTLTHVPTEIVVIDGRYFARIHSLTNSTYTLIYHPVEFADVAGHWSRAAVNNMGSRLIITGYADGTFQPEKPITRAEFAALIVRALGLRLPTQAVPFSDVKTGDWFCEAVRLAHENGIISGYSDGTFRPDSLITREEAMAMLSRAMGVAKLSAGPGSEAAVAAFKDARSVASWSLEAVRACVSAGLANGSGGYLRPQASITRAETATMLQRLLQKAGLID